MSDGRSSFGRRTFLGSGMALSASAVAAGAVVDGSAPAGASARPARSLGEVGPSAAAPRGSLRAGSLTVSGLTAAVGIDPDDCQFAWTLRATGRGARQTAYRIAVRRRDAGHKGRVWDSGTVSTAQQAFVLYGGATLDGDAAYEWTVRARDNAGRWGPVSAPMAFSTSLRMADWKAQWLRPAAASAQPDRVTYLRSTLTPPAGTLQRATVYTSAAHTYRLYLNGHAVDAWPSFSYPDEQYARAVDVTRAVRTGRPNALGVLHRWYGGGQGRPASSPGLLVQLSLWYRDGRRFVSGSDGTWRELPAEWLPSPLRNSDGGDFVEWVDGRAHPRGWSDPGFDDEDWAEATVLGPAGTAPFTGMVPQRTRIAEHQVSPVRVHALASGAVVADFGAVYAARPLVEFPCGDSGRTVTGRVGYLLDPDGQVSTLHGTQGSNLSFSYIMGDGPQTFEGFTYCGFRYLQVDNPGQSMGAIHLAAIARHAAMPNVSMATFSSGNHTLDAVWKLNARSCLYCSQEQFVDTPTREKGQFVWDAANESEGVMRAYGDQNLTWQALRDVLRGQRRYWPDGRVNAVYPNDDGARSFGTFTARYPEWVWRYYASTGDRATAILFYSSVTKVAAWLWSAQQANGLLYGLADQSNGDPVYGYDLSVVTDTASNVLAVNAFNRVAQLAEIAGDHGGTLLWQDRARQLTDSINANLRRSDGVYVDGVLAGGAQSSSASQEANALALAYGVVPAADVARAGAYVASLGVHLGPNHGLELLRGLAAAGRPDAVVQTLTDRSTPGWAHIVATGGTFTWEVWSPSDLIGDSMSHGWGSSALVAMQETLLGVSFRTPNPDGTTRLSVAPPRRGLRRASGSAPTVAGPVAVAWQRAGRGITLDLTMPANMTAMVHLPATSAAHVREGGVAAHASPGVVVRSVGDGLAVLEVGSGSYRFTSS
ncbi:MAG TPA: family 78 glycoside hydrolase catalytic domain [Acidimicrobiales bacterium]|nr:family 78 glycoside hydrolase catalytic domain [Acidimicrobiales bacterium]